jgi:hypothetical protein
LARRNLFDDIKPGFAPALSQPRAGQNISEEPFRPEMIQHPTNYTPIEFKTTNPGNLDLNESLPNTNPVVGRNLFLLNAFPIHKNDNLAMKGIKGLGNFVASTFDAPVEALRKLSLQGGSVLTGNGLRNDLPKNTTFTGDILPRGAADTLNTFQMKHPVLGGLANAAIETAVDPTMFIGEKALANFLKPKTNLTEISLPKNPFSDVPQAPTREDVPQLRQTIALPKVNAQNVTEQAAKIDFPNPLKMQPSDKAKVLASKIESPTMQTSTLESPLPKNRQFAENSVLNSHVATDPLKESIKESMPTYEPITNKATFDKASDIVNQDYTKAVSTFSDAKHGVNADDVALGEALITKAIKEGNADEANRLIADLAEKLTTAGQAVQAASIFKRLTPEGMLLYAQRMINRANRDLFDRLGKKAQNIVLTSDDSEFILNTMKNVQKMSEGRERDVELAKVMARIANKVPATNGTKVKGLQRISMLLNPKTMVRNTIGNALFGAVDNASNVLATPLDFAMGKLTGQRTTTLPSFTGQLKSMKKGAKETLEDAKLGIDTYPAQTQYELPNGRVFDTDFLNNLDRVTRTGLQLGDRPFYQAAYDDVLRQQMKLAKVSEPTKEMMERAEKIAKERTYQDVNNITEAADWFRNAFNKITGSKNFGLGNVILPFTKTPANILKRAIEYSPIGLEKTVRETVNLVKKNGKFDQKAFVDSISRSTTGTGLIMAGYALAEKGLLTGTGNKDKDIASFERNLGKSDFAVKLGDTYYTYDWAQPASLALAVGADMYLKGKSKKEAENAVIEGVKSGGETLLKQSFMQGVQRLFGGYAPMDNLEQTAYNAPAQFIPTLSNQIAQLTDSQKRSTYGGSVQQNALNSIKAKIPGLSKTLEPSIDTLGNPIQQYQGNNNLFNVFLNPGRQTTFNPNKAQSEILRVYESTGNKDVFPKVAPRSFTNKGETITLTPKEITTFQQTMGKNTESRLNYIADQPSTDEMKAKLMAEAIRKAYEEAKQKILDERK